MVLLPDQQVFFLVYEVLPLIFAHLEIGGELYGVGRTCFFAVAAKDAAREVDAEKLEIPPAVLVLGRLERNTVHGAGHSAEIAGDAALLAVRVPGEDDPAAPPGRDVRPLLGVLDRRFRNMAEDWQSVFRRLNIKTLLTG
jgi:hypothetical protein